MEKNFPDNLLSERHRDLLNKKEYIAIGKKGEREVLATGEIDPFAVAKGLDMAYKLKGRYEADKLDVTSRGKTIPSILGGASVRPNHSDT